MRSLGIRHSREGGSEPLRNPDARPLQVVHEGQQRAEHVLGGGVSFVAVAVHRPQDDGLERGLDVPVVHARRYQLLVEHHVHQGVDVVGIEGHLPRYRLVESDSDCVDIQPLVEVSRRSDLLGRHVVGGAQDRPALSEPGSVMSRAGNHLRGAEIEELDVGEVLPRIHEVDVFGLEVAVDDPLRVGCGEPRENLGDDERRRADIHFAVAVDEIVEALAFQVLHHDKGDALGGRSDIVDVNDTSMTGGRCDLRLSFETLEVSRVLEQLRRRDLDRDPFFELLVLRYEHLSHTALANGADESVLPSEQVSSFGHPEEIS